MGFEGIDFLDFAHPKQGMSNNHGKATKIFLQHSSKPREGELCENNDEHVDCSVLPVVNDN